MFLIKLINYIILMIKFILFLIIILPWSICKLSFRKIIGKSIQGIKIVGPNIISSFSKNDNIIISALSVKNLISIKKQILKINKKVNIINLV